MGPFYLNTYLKDYLCYISIIFDRFDFLIERKNESCDFDNKKHDF